MEVNGAVIAMVIADVISPPFAVFAVLFHFFPVEAPMHCHCAILLFELFLLQFCIPRTSVAQSSLKEAVGSERSLGQCLLIIHTLFSILLGNATLEISCNMCTRPLARNLLLVRTFLATLHNSKSRSCGCS